MPFSLTPRLWQVRLFAVLLLASLGTALFGQSNQPSPTDGFDPNANSTVNTVLVQRDGKVVLGGAFTTLRPNGVADNVDRNYVARLHSDGTLDQDFNPNANGQVFAMAVQSTGKIIIGGTFTSVGGVARNRIARLNTDGTVDSTFNIDLGGGLAPEVYALLVMPDDRVVVGGSFTTVGGVARNRLVRFSANGVLDSSFNPNPNASVLSLARQSSGKLLVGGSFTSFQPAGVGDVTTRRYFARLNSDGTPDSEFDPKPDGSVRTIVVQTDGAFVIGGNFNTVQPFGAENPSSRSRIARFSESGELDAAYTPNANGQVSALVLQPDGRLLLGGSFTSLVPNGGVSLTRSYVARLNVDGTVDSSFQVQVNKDVQALGLQGDGRIVIGGIFTQLRVNSLTAVVNRNRVARLNADGTPDTTLDPAGTGLVTVQAIQSDGKIVIGGSFGIMGGLTRNYLARLNVDGTVDTAFKPVINSPVGSIAIQADQSILIGGSFTNIDGIAQSFLARLKPDGSLDTSFVPMMASTVSAIAVQSDGKIIVSGAFLGITPAGGEFAARNHFARLTSTGALDPDFNPNSDGSANVITVLGDGKILVGGDFGGFAPNNGTSVLRSYSAKLNSDGTVDTTYDPQPNGPVRAQVVQDDGKIVLAGEFVTIAPKGAAPTIRYYLVRLNSDSTIDTAYNPRASTFVSALALQKADGKIIAGGQFDFFRPGDDPAKTVDRSRIARINTDGTIDTTYDPHMSGQVLSLLMLSSGKVIAAGGFTALKPAGRDLALTPYRIVRLNVDGTVDGGFDPGVTTQNGGSVETLALQPDSKLLVAGAFNGLSGSRSSNLTRFTASGNVDASYFPNPNGPVSSVLVQPSRTVVPQANVFAWFNSDGALRPSFSMSAVSQLSGQINAVLRQPDGKIILAGNFTNKAGTTGDYLIRLNTNGTFDMSYDPRPAGTINALALQSDGKLIIGGSFDSVGGVTRYRLARLNVDGTVDSTYNPYPGDAVYALALQSDGKLIVGGNFTTFQPNGATATTTRNYLGRLNTDGSLDTAYNPFPGAAVRALLLQDDGQLLIGGDFTTLQPNNAASVTTRNYIARLKDTGELDANFDPSANGAVYAIAIQPSDKKPIIGGVFTTLSPPTSSSFVRAFVARLNVDGTVDSNFNPNPNNIVRTISIVSDTNENVLIGGSFTALQPGTSLDPIGRNHLALVRSDGTVNPNFNPGPGGDVFASIALNDSSFLVGGSFTSLTANASLVVGGNFTAIGGSTISNLALVDGDGSANPTFAPNPDGPVTAIVQQPDTKLIVGGGFAHMAGLTRNRLARLTTDGAIDSGFNPNIEGGVVSAVALQADGKVVVGGAFTSVGGVARARLARLNSDGSIDGSFAATTDAQVSALVLQPDGKIIIAGLFSTVGGQVRNRLARLNADGSLDAGFSPSVNGGVESVVLSINGKITIGGTFTQVSGAPRSNLARLNADGSLDTSFDSGTDGSVLALALQTEGTTLLGGSFSTVAGLPRFRLARLSAGTNVSLQSVSASADRSALTWTRTGGGPELSAARFEISTDALTWTALPGNATRVGTSSWRLSGLNLAASTTFYVRALGSAPTSKNTSFGLVRSEQMFNFAQTPVLAASATVAASTDKTFRYATSDGKAAAYSATGLPAGLSIDAVTGMITGTPAQTGNFAVTIMASTAAGNVSGQLSLNVSNSASSSGGQGVRLINLSTRAQVNGSDTLITGFVTTGGQILIRAVGPGLAPYNVTDAIADPVLRVFNSSGVKVYESNDWTGSEIMTANAATGAFPLATKDAALLVTLAPGAYTAHVTDATGKGGGVLTEVYDAETANTTSRFVNLSNRSRVTLGVPLIGGFVVLSADGTTGQRVLIRGIGPGLKQYNVSSVLENPVLKVFDADNRLIAENDNWSAADGTAAAAASTGAFELATGSNDSALVLTLTPGSYTFQITGAAGSVASGEALADIYIVP